MQQKKSYYLQIDALKGLAIFMVILAHAIILYPVNLHEDPFYKYLFRLLSNIHMPLFFAVSGYCFSYRGDYGSYILKKAKRLMVPYLVFNFADVITRQVMSGLVNRPKGILESIKSMLFYGGEYWFLYTLFLIFLIYPFLYRWQQKSLKRKIWVSVGLLLVASLENQIKFLTIHNFAHYLFFFNAGTLLRDSGAPMFDKKLPRYTWAICFGLMILWFGSMLLSINQFFGNIMSLIAIIACYLLTQSNMFNQLFSRFGKYSLQLYLLNGFMLVLSRTVICRITTNSTTIVLFNMLVDLGLSYILIKYVCKRIPIVRTLMGIS